MESIYHMFKMRFKYLSRVLRSEMLRLLWLLLRPIFALEKKLKPHQNSDGFKIFIIVIGGMGDCLLFDTLFRRIKEKWPDATIDVMTGFFGDLWERFDSIDNVYYLKATKFKSMWDYIRLFRKIYLKQYDIAAEGIAMLPPRGIYPFLPRLVFQASNAPTRIGRRRFGLVQGMRVGIDGFRSSHPTQHKTNGQGNDRNPHITHIIELLPPTERSYHESAKVFEPLNLAYHRKKDEPRLYANPQQDAWAEQLLRKQWASHKDIIIGFSIETTRRIKSWPLRHFIRILDWGIGDGLKFVMIGAEKTPQQSPLKKYAHKDLLNLSGMTTLGEMMSVIQQCQIFLSCDTGPAHIAQAYRVPTIVLFGPSNELEFGPVDHDLHSLVLPPEDPGCRPCVLGPCIREERCMKLIQPEAVYAELQKKVASVPYGKSESKNKPHQSPYVLCEI